MGKLNENASLDFKWLKKRDDGKNNGVQFYESFIYDGVKYKLYDCVYMHNGGVQEPYIGMLTKLWESADKTKKFEVHWFFRPEEISKWLGETRTLKNEILFATGEGLGLANINPLEAILDRCNVVCISKDDRNPQPSDEQLKAADFVFYRTFDVQSYAISDKMDDKVGGLEIKYVLNREECEKARPFLESISDTLKDDAKREPQNNGIPSLLERNTNFVESDKLHDRPSKKIKSDDKCVKPGEMMDMPSMKSMVDKSDKGMKSLEIKGRNTTTTGSDKLLDQPSMKFKSDKKLPLSKLVELEVACDTERSKEMSSRKSVVDSKPKHEGKSRADVSRTEVRNERNISAKETLDDLESKKSKKTTDNGSFKAPDSNDYNGQSGVNNLKSSGTFGRTEDRNKRKSSAKETSDDLERKKSKRTTDDASFKVPDSKLGMNMNDKKNNNYNEEAKQVQSGESKKKLSMNKPPKESALSTDKDKRNAYREFVVTSKPNAESRCWWPQPQLAWENRLKNAYKEGTAILLHNVDPRYNSRKIEDIIWSAFKVDCDAKILQRTSVSSPHYAQALIILGRKEAAQRILRKLDKECLMLPDGRNRFIPLVATPCPPILTKNNSSFFGHLAVGKARFQNRREAEAVSTSHFSQPNTIEYDMAMDWCLLQFQSKKGWENLHEQQGLELENLLNDLQ